MNGPDKPKWTRDMVNDIGCLFQLIRYIEGTEMCLLDHRHEVPKYRKITYICIVCDIRPHKKENHKMQLTVGGNRITYYGTVPTPTAYLTM